MIKPCKDCPDRKIKCHASCDKYKAFSEERERFRQVQHTETRLKEYYIERDRKIFDKSRRNKRFRRFK